MLNLGFEGINANMLALSHRIPKTLKQIRTSKGKCVFFEARDLKFGIKIHDIIAIN